MRQNTLNIGILFFEHYRFSEGNRQKSLIVEVFELSRFKLMWFYSILTAQILNRLARYTDKENKKVTLSYFQHKEVTYTSSWFIS